jgi:hypothetical protein
LSVLTLGVIFAEMRKDKNETPSSAPTEENEVAPMPYVIYEEAPLVMEELPLIEPTTIEEALDLMTKCEARKDAAHTMADSARSLGYTDEHPIVQLAMQEWNRAEEQRVVYQAKYDQFVQDKWYARTQEYPEATYIWLYLKELGYNDYVCAGIMGNIMTEVGGQTLNIDPTLYSPGNYFYGICQWNKKNYSQIRGADLATQCDFLRDTIEYEFKVYGYVYAKGFGYEDFLNITDARAAALAFARVYERCGEESHRIRQDNAEKALNYFTK